MKPSGDAQIPIVMPKGLEDFFTLQAGMP